MSEAEPVKNSLQQLSNKYQTNHESLLNYFSNLFAAAILPFRVQVNFDSGEEVSAMTDASTDEMHTFPGGIVGFRLAYTQQTAAGASCA